MFRDRDGWRVQWVDFETQKRQSRRFDRKGEARLFEAELKQGLLKGPAASLTFREFAGRWLEDYCKKQKAESQWSCDESAIRVHLMPALGDLRLAQMKPAKLEEFRRGLRAKKRANGKALAPKSVNLILSLLKTMFRTAERWGYLDGNPAAKLDLYPLPERRIQYWTVDERDRFLRFARSIDPPFADLATMACFTGLRRGELAGLRRYQLDFGRCMIEVSAVHCFRSGKRIERTKNRRIGWVPMLPEVREVVKALELAPMDAQVFDVREVREGLRKVDRIAKAAGVRRIRFHDMRHTYGSALVSAGVDLYRTQKLMRHETLAMTQRYAHLAPAELQDAALMISAKNKHAGTHANRSGQTIRAGKH